MSNLARIGFGALPAVAVVAFASPAAADRRTGLAGSVVIEDADDVWVYPQLMMLHGNRIAFDFGAMRIGAGGAEEYQGGGSLVLDFGSWAIGAGAHRGDLLRVGDFFANPDADLAGLQGFNGVWDEAWVQAPFPPEPAPTIADLLGALQIGESGTLGLRLTAGYGGTTTTVPMVGAVEGGERYDRQAYVGTTIGYSMRGAANFDTSIEIGWDGATESDSIGSGAGELADGDAVLFGINARGFLPLTDSLDLAVIGAFGLSDYEQNDVQADTVWRRRLFTGYVGAGPRVDLGERASIGGYLTFGFAHNRLKPREEDAGDDDNFTTLLSVPGLHIAGEFEVFDWLLFRAGLYAAHGVYMTSDPNGTETESHPYQFKWHAGVGFRVNDFEFDGAFAGNFLTSGPAFLGQQTPLYVIVSASYRWNYE